MKYIYYFFNLILIVGLFSIKVSAENFDGKKNLFCSVKEAIECYPTSNCNEVSTDVLNFPNFIDIDFKNKTIRGLLSNGEEHKSNIERTEHVDGKITLSGAEEDLKEQVDGVGWSMSLNKTSGKYTIVAAGDDVGFVIFGACTVP